MEGKFSFILMLSNTIKVKMETSILGRTKGQRGKVIGSHCQIYMEHKLDEYDKSKPLIIYEGELDALISTIQGISFSHGCSSS